MARHRTRGHRRPDCRYRGIPISRAPGRDVHRYYHGRCLQERERRRLLRSDLRPRRRHAVDWRGGRGAVGARRGLGGHRRGRQSPVVLMGRRRVQVHRCRRDLAEDGSCGYAPHRPHRDSSVGPGHGVGGRGGTPLGLQLRTGRLQDDRRRAHLEACAVPRRAHRRHRPGPGPAESEHGLCRHVPAPAGGLGVHGGGPGSGIFRTTDGGATWKELQPRIPAGTKAASG